MQYVIKRNGIKEKFSQKKILTSIKNAAKSSGEFDGKIAEKLTTKVMSILSHLETDCIDTEKIQDIIEEVLLNSPYKKTAKAFILYRDKKSLFNEMNKILSEDLIEPYISKNDWQVKENANIAYSLAGLNFYLSSSINKRYWLYKIYPEEIRKAHEDGYIKIHDLGQLSAYCVGWSLPDLLQKGITGVSGFVHSRPAKHLSAILDQMASFFSILASETAGAQAFSNVDILLAPFIREDKLSYKEVKQMIQQFIFSLNYPVRPGGQSCFSNITLDLVPPKQLKDLPVIVGGELKDTTYKEYQKEIDLFNEAFCDVLLDGDSVGAPFTFPIPTINITKDFDWNSPVVKKIMEVTTKYGSFYFANFINSNLDPADSFSMCCRLRLDLNELHHKGQGLFGANPKTGSIGVVTINLPRIGYLANNEKEYFELLDHYMNLAKLSLEIKRKTVESFTERNFYPYTKVYLSDIKQKTGKYWANHFSTIGIIGMNESLLNFMGKDITTKEGLEFAIKVLNFMNKKLIEYQKETGNLYNLEATPAEGTSTELALKDKQKYSDIITAGVNAPYYTNSVHVPVNSNLDLMQIIEHQNYLLPLFTGGSVLHIYLKESPDPTIVAKFIKKIFTNYRIPYISITPTYSVCEDHGYLKGEHYTCTQCGKETTVWSRVVGYLRPVQNWNIGKQEEWRQRVKWMLK